VQFFVKSQAFDANYPVGSDARVVVEESVYASEILSCREDGVGTGICLLLNVISCRTLQSWHGMKVTSYLFTLF